MEEKLETIPGNLEYWLSLKYDFSLSISILRFQLFCYTVYLIIHRVSKGHVFLRKIFVVDFCSACNIRRNDFRHWISQNLGEKFIKEIFRMKKFKLEEQIFGEGEGVLHVVKVDWLILFLIQNSVWNLHIFTLIFLCS